MNNNMQSLQSKLQLEARNNAVLKNQLTHLRDNYFQSKQNSQLTGSPDNKMNSLRINLPSEQSSAHAEQAIDQQVPNPARNSIAQNQPDMEDFEEEKPDMRSVLGFLNQNEWIYNLNIGNIMQI